MSATGARSFVCRCAGLRRAVLTFAAGLGLAAALRAEDVAIRYGTVTAEPVRLTHAGPLVGETAKPTRAAFAVILITPDGNLAAEDMQAARDAAQKMTELLLGAARMKFGAEVPITHELIVASPADAPGQRQRLTDAGFTFINRTSVRTASQQRVGVENFGLKVFDDAAVLGDAEVTLVLAARPAISAQGDIKLNLEVTAEAARITRRAGGTDDAAAQAALARFQKEAVEQAKGMLFAANWRKWTLTSRDLEAIARGAVPLRKAVPLEVHGQAPRLRLTIPAEVVFPSAGTTAWGEPE